MARGARRGRRERRRPSARSSWSRASSSAPAARRAAARPGPDPVHQHDPAAARGAAPGRPRARAPHPLARSAGTRWRWCCSANKESSELGGHIASYASAATLYEVGFNHFWRAPSDDARRRPRLHPGALLARHLRARLPRGPAHRGAARQLPPGGRDGRRPVVVSAPVADAGLLAVPDGVDGPRPDHGDLPGALHEATCTDRGLADTERPQGLGVPRRRRDGRARVAGRDRAWPSREKLDNLIFVVNCNLQRLDGPVRGNGKIIQELEADLPRRRLERHQGHLGPTLGPAARARPRRACSCGGWRRPSTASTRTTRRGTAPTCASTSSASTPSCARWSPTCPTRRSGR